MTYKIAIGSDHAGYVLKEEIKRHLVEKRFIIKDFGPDSDESSDYPDYAHPVAKAIANREFDFGILICGSGIGVSITANKHQKIRAALCWNVELARLSRTHNDANILCLGARYTAKELAIKMVDAFLETGFEGGRHLRRINKIPLKD